MKITMRDQVISEIRKIREAYAEKFNYDVYAMLRDLKERQSKSGRKTVSLPSKRSKSTVYTINTTIQNS